MFQGLNLLIFGAHLVPYKQICELPTFSDDAAQSTPKPVASQRPCPVPQPVSTTTFIITAGIIPIYTDYIHNLPKRKPQSIEEYIKVCTLKSNIRTFVMIRSCGKLLRCFLIYFPVLHTTGQATRVALDVQNVCELFNSLRPSDAYMCQLTNHHWSR